MAGPPPLLRDDRLDLVTLSAMALTFDQLSAEDGRTWPAAAFVRWLRAEVQATVQPQRRSEDEAA